MGKSKHLIFECSICHYPTTRKFNINRHVRDVHKINSEVERNKTILIRTKQSATPAGTIPSDYLVFHDKDRSSINSFNHNPHDSFMSMIEQITRDFKALNRLGTEMNYLRYNFPTITNGLTWTTPNTAVAHSNSQLIGFRGFVCDRCFAASVTPLLLHHESHKLIGGIANHYCSVKSEVKNGKMKSVQAHSDLIDLLSRQLQTAFGHEFYLHIKNLPDSFDFGQESIFNPIDFGVPAIDDPIWLAIKTGSESVKLTNSTLHNFLAKTNASYCLATFHDNSSELRFMLMIGTSYEQLPQEQNYPK